MATVPTQIRIDAQVKEEAGELFKELGLDMSSAVNIFLRQCVMHDGLPFPVERPHYNQETVNAMREAKAISKDPDVKGYTNLSDLKEALLSE